MQTKKAIRKQRTAFLYLGYINLFLLVGQKLISHCIG